MRGCEDAGVCASAQVQQARATPCSNTRRPRSRVRAPRASSTCATLASTAAMRIWCPLASAVRGSRMRGMLLRVSTARRRPERLTARPLRGRRCSARLCRLRPRWPGVSARCRRPRALLGRETQRAHVTGHPSRSVRLARAAGDASALRRARVAADPLAALDGKRKATQGLTSFFGCHGISQLVPETFSQLVTGRYWIF